MYRKRVFLNPISLSAPSFIQAVADSSDEGTYLLGSYILIIADCDRRIMLEFGLANPRQRKANLAKIDRLLSIILTLDVYSHVLPDMQKAATDKPENILCRRTGTL